MKIDLKQKFKDIVRGERMQKFLAFVISLYSKFVYKTSKIELKGYGEEYLKALQEEKANFIITWHGRIFISGAFINDYLKKINYKKQLLVLSSKHKDGELASKTLEFFNFKKIGGSTINKKKLDKQIESGAVRSIIISMRELKRNNATIFLAPDGPRGPNHQLNSSIVEIAQKTNAMIFPVSISYLKKKQLHSWDEFQIPMPFNKIIIEFLEPITIEKTDNCKEIETKITNDMNETLEKNDNLINNCN